MKMTKIMMKTMLNLIRGVPSPHDGLIIIIIIIIIIKIILKVITLKVITQSTFL